MLGFNKLNFDLVTATIFCFFLGPQQENIPWWGKYILGGKHTLRGKNILNIIT